MPDETRKELENLIVETIEYCHRQSYRGKETVARMLGVETVFRFKIDGKNYAVTVREDN